MSTRRRYRSSLREERAQDTRLRILRSARTLFASEGFVETTITQIADDAGVAPQTIYGVFGNKGAIVIGVIEELERSADLDSLGARILAEEDPRRQLRIFVSWIRTFLEQGAPVLRAALAARGDPHVAALAERGDGNRLGGTTALAKGWSHSQVLRDGVGPNQAAQLLWLLTSVEQYLLAVDGLGWTPDRYERWLGDLLERELFGAGVKNMPSRASSSTR